MAFINQGGLLELTKNKNKKKQSIIQQVNIVLCVGMYYYYTVHYSELLGSDCFCLHYECIWAHLHIIGCYCSFSFLPLLRQCFAFYFEGLYKSIISAFEANADLLHFHYYLSHSAFPAISH